MTDFQSRRPTNSCTENDTVDRLRGHDADYVAFSGKGTPRRKVKRAPARSGTDDKKLQQTLKKLNVQPIQAIEEVNMFKSDGNVIHFAAPKGKRRHREAEIGQATRKRG